MGPESDLRDSHGWEPRRRYVSFDPYAPWQIQREWDLRPLELLLLINLTLTVSKRDLRWRGSMSDIREDTGLSRNTIPKLIDELIQKGWVVEDRPFRQGGSAILSLPRCETMIRLHPAHRRSLESARFDSPEIAPPLPNDRVDIKRPLSNGARSTCDDSESPGIWLQGDEGDSDPDDLDWCLICKAPTKGHPFVEDHEPQSALQAASADRVPLELFEDADTWESDDARDAGSASDRVPPQLNPAPHDRAGCGGRLSESRC